MYAVRAIWANGSICTVLADPRRLSARMLPRRKTRQPTHTGAHLVVQGVICFASTSATNADWTSTRVSFTLTVDPVVPLPSFLVKKRAKGLIRTATDGLRKRVMKVKGH